MKRKPLTLPALRGSFGRWIYYSCLMPIGDIAERVSFAEEVHRSKALSELIQRSLTGSRAKKIAQYLTTTQDRFFNSLVIATYGGAPEWLEVGNFEANRDRRLLSAIPERAQDTLGFLRLTGPEKMFALDGQHRLAGIREALTQTPDTLKEDVLPVLLVGHRKDAAGMQRTRRLFTTLNKTAVPVQKRDIIALDEDDAMAIITRRLVETNRSFHHPKIAVISSLNMPTSNRESFITIATLYDILKIIFLDMIGKRSDQSLRFNRPSDERLDEFYAAAANYFSALGKTFKPVRDALSAGNPELITSKHRGPHGGHLLFRSIGIEIFTRTATALARQRRLSIQAAVQELGAIPTDISAPPFVGVIWDPARKTILPKGKTLARNLLFHMAGLSTNEAALLVEYRKALGADEHVEVDLPPRVVRAARQ